MGKFSLRNIECVPGRCGGKPVVVGTRIRVATLLICHRMGWTVEEILQQYSTLRPSDIHDALAYAFDHIAEIEADIAADSEEAVKAQFGRH